MATLEIRGETLKQLRETFLKMTSPEWESALAGKPKEVVNEAAKQLLAVQSARLRLENAELAEIRDKLIENESALEEGRQHVARALEKLTQVENVIGAVSSFLSVVGRVVSLV